MKILCDHCGAKYTIADEKVRGRVFKLRCKKCGEAIIIRGDESPATQSEETAVGGDEAPSGSNHLPPEEGVWHLVVDRKQVGPMDVEEIRALFEDGSITVDTFAWREGFDEWLKVSAIEELAALAPKGAAAHEGDDGDEPPSEESTRKTNSNDVFSKHQAQTAKAEEEEEGQELFGARAPDPVRPASPAKAAAAPVAAPEKRPAGRSGVLPARRAFHEASTAAPTAAKIAEVAHESASTGDTGGDDEEEGDDAAGESPRVNVDSSKLTGQRRESSVLFSLNNLDALGADMRAGKSSSSSSEAPVSKPGHANAKEGGSGLIDIRAMAAVALSGKAHTDKSASIDPGPVFAPSIATPIMMPTPSGMPKWVWAIIGGGGLVLLSMIGLVTVMVLKRPPAPPTPAPIDIQKPVDKPMVVATADPTAAKPAAAVAQPIALPPDPPPAHEEHAAAAPSKHHHGDSHSAPKTSATVAAKAAAPAHDDPLPPPSKKPRGKDSDLDDLINSAAPKSSRSAPTPKASAPADDPSLPETLSRADVMAGMSAIQPRALACQQQYHVGGTAMVKVTIGKNGRVGGAVVQGALAGTPTGNCVSRAVQSGTFKKFRGNPMTITYPFILR